jgi:hypothetical protein
LDKVSWYELSKNPNGFNLLNQNREKWDIPPSQSVGIDVLIDNPDNINWYYLSKNPEAIELLKQNLDKVSKASLSENPAIFVYDYPNMTRPFTEELMANRFHPRYIQLFDLWGFDS